MTGYARTCLGLLAPVVTLFVIAGCSCDRPPAQTNPPTNPSDIVAAAGLGVDGRSDVEKVRTADYSILFVGNSHTSSHNLPNLVCEMIQFRHPGKTTYSHALSVAFLEDVERIPGCREEIESRPWKFVVLQAQKISVSGKQEYSRKEGIEFAKLAKNRGASVHFYCEWGLKDVPDNGPRQEKVYTEMAAEAGVKVAPVNRAWDLALAVRPEMPLYEFDGNHQSATGAFLTAAFLYAKLTGENPAPLAAFPFKDVNEADRAFLAEAAATAAGKP